MTSQGFPREVRLLNASEYTSVFQGALKRKSSLFMRIIAMPQKESIASVGRVGIIASKRFIPLAVERNRLKRLVREWFRCHKHLCGSWDYVVIIKSASGTLSKKAFNKQLNTLWLDLIK